MDDQLFEDALARALHGEVLTDIGASVELTAALIRVASAPSRDAQRVSMRAARLLHERQTRPADPDGPSDSDDPDDPDHPDDPGPSSADWSTGD